MVKDPGIPTPMKRVSCPLQVTSTYTAISLPRFLIPFYETEMGTDEAKVLMLLFLHYGRRDVSSEGTCPFHQAKYMDCLALVIYV